MSVCSRAMREDDLGPAVDLWAQAYRLDPTYLRSEFTSEPDRRWDQTTVATDGSGRLLSVAHFVRRDLRRPDGGVWRVGGVAYVATREDARRQGLSTELLRRTISGMEAAGVDWSMLYTGVNKHYERLGWRTLRTRYRVGSIRAAGAEPQGPYRTWRYNPKEQSAGWIPLAKAYEEYNRGRALTTVRSEEYWRSVMPLRFLAPHALVLAACPRGASCDPVGYVLVSFHDPETAAITEIGVRSGHEAAVDPLIEAACRAASLRGLRRAVVYLPVEEVVDRALDRSLTDIATEYHGAVMVRPISPDFDDREVDEAYGQAGAIIWPSDDF